MIILNDQPLKIQQQHSRPKVEKREHQYQLQLVKKWTNEEVNKWRSEQMEQMKKWTNGTNEEVEED